MVLNPESYILPRRRFLPLAGAGFGLSCLTANYALASTYPAHPITFIIPDSINGGAAAYAREFAVRLKDYLVPHQNVVVVSDQGADGQKAVFDLYRTTPDGYTIAMLGEVLSIKQGNNMLNELTWLATIGRASFGMITAKNSAITSVADLRALGQKREVVFSVSGEGSLNYFAITMFCRMLKIPYRIVTGYKGSTGSILAVVRGEVDATAESVPTLHEYVADGFVRMIFIYDKATDLPDVADAVSIGAPDLSNVVQWRFVAAPPGMDPALTNRLSQAFLDIVKMPEVVSWAGKVGIPLYSAGPKETAELVGSQLKFIQTWNLA